MAGREDAGGTILERPWVGFGRETCGVLDAALRREWLITNGLGGYAMGSLAGIPTRRYHGWLVAALSPPVERTLLVGGLDEWLSANGRRTPLAAFEFADGSLAPDGWRHLQSFALEGSLPVWRYAAGDRLLERRAWMVHGQNTTLVRYELLRGETAELAVTPLVTCRDHHALARATDVSVALEPGPQGATVAFGHRPVRLVLRAEDGRFDLAGEWWWGFQHREEEARGLDHHSDLLAAGTFHFELRAGEAVELLLSAETGPEAAGGGLEQEQERQRVLLMLADATAAEPPVQQLVLAADQLIVQRRLPGGASVPTIIAGYPWFTDWGRDTFIALPGLLLTTGREPEAADLLRAFAGFVRDGLVPNTFPEGGTEPLDNTADASLWYVLAVAAWERATGDATLGRELLPVLTAIIEAHIRGTRHGIGIDPVDGLLRQGEDGSALTWMDARVDGVPVTPRAGKVVELQALWYDALCIVAALCATAGDSRAEGWFSLAEQVAGSFRRRFVRPDGGLLDVVDGREGDDPRIRPNQLLALSLPYPLLDGGVGERVLEVVGDELLTSFGLRTLAPSDPDHRDAYAGGPAERDAGYHQGPAWGWLFGPWVDASSRLRPQDAGARLALAPFADHLRDAGLGTVSELFDSAPPHLPRGAVAQAWSVAEVLRAWSFLAPWTRRGAQRPPSRPR